MAHQQKPAPYCITSPGLPNINSGVLRNRHSLRRASSNLLLGTHAHKHLGTYAQTTVMQGPVRKLANLKTSGSLVSPQAARFANQHAYHSAAITDFACRKRPPSRTLRSAMLSFPLEWHNGTSTMLETGRSHVRHPVR